MRKPFLSLSAIAMTFVLALSAEADIVSLILTGNGGDGLLGTNVTPPATNPGSGGIGAGGITLDTDTGALNIDIEWGSGNGYTDLSGVVTMLHLHGPTPDAAPDSFSQTGGLLINLAASPGFDDSPTSGGLVGSFFVESGNRPSILSGRTYINVHTDLNTTGEIRGYLTTPVPEPNAFAIIGILVLAAMTAFILRRRSAANNFIVQ